MMQNSIGSGNNIGDKDFVKLCPLCNSAVKISNINLTEKVPMCQNLYCEYPFDQELQFVPLHYKAKLDVGTSSLARDNKAGSSSVTSHSASSDINKLDVAQKNKTKPYMHIINKKKLKKNVQDLKHLTKELNKVDQNKGKSDSIKNEKWLKNLIKIQGSSGAKLVKKEEMKLLKEKTSAVGGGELKIDINTNKNNIFAINVQIMNKHAD